MKFFRLIIVFFLLPSYLSAQDANSSLQKLRDAIKDAQINKKALKLFEQIPDFVKTVQVPQLLSSVLSQALAFTGVTLKEGDELPVITDSRGGSSLKGKVGFTATINMGNGQNLEVFFGVYENFGKFTLGLKYPPSFKISSLIPALKPLDVISLPQIQLVFSTFSYINKEGAEIRNGTNLVGLVNLDGPLKLFNDLKNGAARGFKSIVFDFDYPIQLTGRIPYIPTTFSFKLKIPMRIGIDFTQISQIPKELSGFLRKITTDDIVLNISVGRSASKSKEEEQEGDEGDQEKQEPKQDAPKATVEIAAQTGIRITLGTQKEPILIQGFGRVNPLTTDFSIGGKFPSMLEATYFALGDAGIELYWDSGVREVLLALGVPLSGIGLRGRIDLGTPSNSRASLEAVGKVAIQKEGGIGLIFDVTGKNLYFSDIIKLMTRAIAKANITTPIPADLIPTLAVEKVRGKFAPFGDSVAGRSISSGYALAMEMNLFDQQFGFNVDGDFDNLKFSGSGWLPKIELKAGSDLIFVLGDSGKFKRPSEIKSDGPYASMVFEAKRPDKAAFNISALFNMPPLALKESVDLHYYRGNLIVDIETNNIGFTTLFNITINPRKWKEMAVSFSFKDDFNKFLQTQIKPVVKQLQQDMQKGGQQLNAFTSALTGQMQGLSKVLNAGADTEIGKTERKIADLKKKIADLRAECDDAVWYDKTWKCPKVAGELIAPGTELAGLETYLEGLLKPGKEVINKTEPAAETSVKAVGQAGAEVTGVLSTTVINTLMDAADKGSSLFVVHEVSGGVSMSDLIKGKLPILKVLNVSITLPGKSPISVKLNDISFDFKQPQNSARDLVQKILKAAHF